MSPVSKGLLLGTFTCGWVSSTLQWKQLMLASRETFYIKCFPGSRDGVEGAFTDLWPSSTSKDFINCTSSWRLQRPPLARNAWHVFIIGKKCICNVHVRPTEGDILLAITVHLCHSWTWAGGTVLLPLFFPPSSGSGTELLWAALSGRLDLSVSQGLGSAHALAADFQGSSLVGGDTLVVGAQVCLNLFPHLPLGVQLLVPLTCESKRSAPWITRTSSGLHITNTGFMGPGAAW